MGIKVRKGGAWVEVSSGGGSGGGDTVSITPTAADILSVSSGAISADDAGSDKIVFWDDSANKLTYLTVGSNLSISGTTISASGGGSGVGIGSTSKIIQGNTSAEVVDTGTDGHFKVLTEGTERFRIGPAGIATFTADITAGGGNPGQINIDPTTSTSNGRIKYSGTKTFMIEGGSGFDNRIEIHGHQNSLNILCEGEGQTELYYNDSKKFETTDAGITVTGISSASEGFDFGVNSSGSPVTTGSVKTLDFVGSGNTITYDASTKTVTIDIDSGSGGGGGGAYDNTTWILGSNGSSDYTFTGPGLTGAENDPTIYLVRGQKYRFTNNSGGSHPFQIRYNSNGTAYSDGVTNNGASSGNIDWNVQFDTPDVLYYQCTSHSGMLGKIIILGDVVSEGSWTASAGTAQTIDTITGVANNAIKTAEYVIHIENGSNIQAQKVLVMQDGTTAYSQEYAIMNKSGLLVSMSATISGGNLLLQATPETGVSGTTTYKITRQTMR